MSEESRPSATALISPIKEDALDAFEAAQLPGLVRLWPFEGIPSLIRLSLKGTITVGRDPSCEVSLVEKTVSRNHAQLRAVGPLIEVKDLGSSNGTFIGNTALEGTAMASPGNLVSFGHCTYLAVESSGPYRDWWTQGEQGPVVGGPTMGLVRNLARQFAPMADPVLVTGETGTGKEVVARQLHEQSARRGEFVAINCAAVPERLFEGQFFGHVRGAFTGADRAEPGFLRAARGGTVFLDEIGELDLLCQPKLLRALEAREVIPLGASRPEPIDVRLVTATNRDLAGAVESGAFRADLYSRVRVLTIALEPLRKRPEDIVLLARRFLAALPIDTLTADAVRALVGYSWPGNARELRNALIEASAAAQADAADVVDVKQLRAEIQAPTSSPAEESASRPAQARTAAVTAAMKKHKGNVSHAAAELGLQRAQVYKVLRAAGIKAADFRDE